MKHTADQEEIGWNHFLLGNMSIKWKQAMHNHYAKLAAASDNKLPKHLFAKVWIKKLLCHVLHISLKMNSTTQSKKTPTTVLNANTFSTKLRKFSAKRHPSNQAFQTLFTHTYHSLASLPNSGIQNWLKSYGLVCKFVGPSLITTHFSQ